MAIYHGVEWHHDALTVLAVCHQQPMIYACDGRDTSYLSQSPVTATHHVPVHTACVLEHLFTDTQSLEHWLDGGFAFEKPHLPLSPAVTTECWLCRLRSHDD